MKKRWRQVSELSGRRASGLLLPAMKIAALYEPLVDRVWHKIVDQPEVIVFLARDGRIMIFVYE